MHDGFSYTRTQTGLGSEDGSSGHSITASDDQRCSHVAFVGKRIPMKHTRTDIVFVDHGILRFNFLHALLAQTDVEYAQLSDELLVLGKEEGQFLLL